MRERGALLQTTEHECSNTLNQTLNTKEDGNIFVKPQ